MNKEERELLLTDLCSRLPYEVKVYNEVLKDTCILKSVDILSPDKITVFCRLLTSSEIGATIEDIKPYLKPIFSMTKEEKKDYELLCDYYMDDKEEEHYFNNFATLDWLNQKHFDYRGLIKLGLALEAPEGMYEY